jgi:hypothetical protein
VAEIAQVIMKRINLYVVMAYDVLDSGRLVEVTADPNDAEFLRIEAERQPDVAYTCIHLRSMLVSDMHLIGVDSGEESAELGRMEPREIPRKRAKKGVQKDANVSRGKGKSKGRVRREVKAW